MKVQKLLNLIKYLGKMIEIFEKSRKNQQIFTKSEKILEKMIEIFEKSRADFRDFLVFQNKKRKMFFSISFIESFCKVLLISKKLQLFYRPIKLSPSL